MNSPLGSVRENPQQNAFPRNTSCAYPFTTTIYPLNIPYCFPSTSSASTPFPSNGFTFPTFQTFEPGTSFPESSPTTQFGWTQHEKPAFTAGTFHQFNRYNSSLKPLSGTFGCKRKPESVPFVPLKQHITEERMAEHMSKLHISSQTAPCSVESEPVRERRLYMCEEMQRLQTESIIPAQILEKVNRPCTALVPWRPPAGRLPLSKENNNNQEEPDNNLADGNCMEMDS